MSGKYVPQYWEKYGVEPAVPVPGGDITPAYPELKRQLYAEQKRLKGMEYGDTDRAVIMQQLEDVQNELDSLLNAYVGGMAEEYGSLPVVKPKPKFVGVVNEKLLENLGKK